MSGMVGLWDFERGQVEPRQLRAMMDQLAHRGPDGSDIWWSGGVGLGHCALWTTPESLHEVMPLKDPSGQFVITADARIDNREELYSLLRLTGSDREKGDGYIILQAYLKWGSRCPEYLLGDFAFAIWDAQQKSLFCARDHMGIKPFYYSYQPGCGFAFSSEIKALRLLPWVSDEINEDRIADYLLADFEDKVRTIYVNISRLPPASTLLISKGGIREQTYWTLNLTRELRFADEHAYVEGFLYYFGAAVEARLRSAFPIGSHLSGGLDSSAVTCMARKLQPNLTLHTFSNVFEKVKECDEQEYQQAVLEAEDYIPHFVVADRYGPLSDSEEIYRFHDEVYFGPTHFLLWGLNRSASQAGIRILLDGFDGDTVLSHGTAWLDELAHQGNWKSFAEEATALAGRGRASRRILQEHGAPHLRHLAQTGTWKRFHEQARQVSKLFNIPILQLWLSCGIKPWLPQTLQESWQHWRTGEHSEDWWNYHLFSSTWREKQGLRHRLEKLKQEGSRIPTSEQQYHEKKVSSGLVTTAMEILDQSAAAWSQEARHPFFDRRVVEFCLALPPTQKLHQGWTRRILRRSMHNILPEKVRLRRNKSNMEPSFFYGLLEINREDLAISMSSSIVETAKIGNLKLARKLYDSARKSSTPRKSSEVMTIWKLSNLSTWHRYRKTRADEASKDI